MSPRRALLSIGCFVVVASAAHPVGAGPADVDVSAYGGSVPGRWTCGPGTDVKYGGVGAQARVALPTEGQPPSLHADDRRGLAVTVRGAIEARSYTLTTCDQGTTCQTPPDAPAGGGAVNVGWDGATIGLHGGVSASQIYDRPEARSHRFQVLPEAHLRVGPRNVFWGEGGIGSYGISTVLRPGLYVGAGLPVGDVVVLTAHAGVHRNFEKESGGRGEMAGHVRLGEARLGAALALQWQRDGAGARPEAALTGGYSF